MKSWAFNIAVAVILIVLLGLLQRQRILLGQRRSELHIRQAAVHAGIPEPLTAPIAPPDDHPSPELLRLRSEVTVLRRELERAATQPFSLERMAEDWGWVQSGPQPSTQPGFMRFDALTNSGFATPETAFSSFNFALRNPAQGMTKAAMKDIWDLPDDLQKPDAKYSIWIGEVLGTVRGYRIVHQERIEANQVRLTVEFERLDGFLFRRDKLLVERNGHWRMQPPSLLRP